MPRRRKTKPETRLRKAQAELHNIKNVVRWAIRELRDPATDVTKVEIANELACIIGEKIIVTAAVPEGEVYDPAEDPHASPDAEHEMMVCNPVAYGQLLQQRERKAKAKTL